MSDRPEAFTDAGEAAWACAGRRLLAYLRCLPLTELRRLELAVDVVRDLQQQPPAPAETVQAAAMGRLREKLVEQLPPSSPPPAVPPLQRSHMAPEEMDRRPWFTSLMRLGRRVGRSFGWGEQPDPLERLRRPAQEREYLNEPWNRIASRRRLILGLLVTLPALAAGPVMASVLPHQGSTPLEMALVAVFTLLFGWISVGFWTAMLGFVTLVRRFDRFAFTRELEPHDHRIKPSVRTALLFPVCNEGMERVSAGILATWRSLERTGKAAPFDVFILSDTGNPDAWIQEELAWRRLCRELGDPGCIFYRRRRVNQKRKSGNVADWCRRFGRRYSYMVVMDADSVMSGPTLVKLVATMERQRHVGILQTAPAVAGRETLLARVQQFASRAYGPMFAAGLHSMQLGDAQFWGHNAILRVKPFMQHCGLPRLPGKPPLGGDILSHDFVESALMRRAGWGVWLAFDLGGSWEESPPTLLAELKRDRRWCNGNLQHLRLVFTRGLFPAHRVLFLNGAMSYISAFLWFLLLLLSTAEAVLEAVLPPSYFPEARTLFPQWPVWDPRWAVGLLVVTAVILFLPKLFSGLLVLRKGRSRKFGGLFRLVGSIIAEVIVSTLLAPIRMLFHTKFVFAILLGTQSGWGQQQRDDLGTPWSDAIRFHWGGTVFALLWGALLFLVNRSFFWWVTPIIVPLMLSIPLSVWTSRASIGRLARRLGLFLTPEEVAPPVELRDVVAYEERFASEQLPLGLSKEQGFVRAVLNPAIHALHLALLARRPLVGKKVRGQRQALVEKALAKGPRGLSAQEKKRLLYDGGMLAELHRRAWELPDQTLREDWGLKLI